MVRVPPGWGKIVPARGWLGEFLAVGQFEMKRPSGAKALFIFGGFAARLKSCPFKADSN
jgi:hypothetical protein